MEGLCLRVAVVVFHTGWGVEGDEEMSRAHSWRKGVNCSRQWPGGKEGSSARASFQSCVNGQAAFQRNVIERDESFSEKPALKGHFSDGLGKRTVCSQSAPLVTKGQINVKSVFPQRQWADYWEWELYSELLPLLEKSYQQDTFLLTTTCQGFFIYQLGHDVCEQTSCLQEIQMGSLLSPFFSCWMQKVRSKAATGILAASTRCSWLCLHQYQRL